MSALASSSRLSMGDVTDIRGHADVAHSLKQTKRSTSSVENQKVLNDV